MGCVIAKYIRLSLEEDKTDSCSISSQRYILDQYIAGMEEEQPRVLEFVDNGYSGTNTERPGLQQLLERVQNGMVDCVVVKDFSRLSRNSLDMGYFMEQIFTLYRVRFIALGDNYDSALQQGANSLDVTFKLLLNECYSRDLSKKVRSAWLARAQAGLSATKNCTYGYRLDEQRRMVLEEEAAETVRQIFSLAALGFKMPEIVAWLYKNQRPTPAFSKGYTKNKNPELQYIWNPSVLHKILRDEQYIGTFVAGKLTALEVGSSKQLRVPEGEWIRIPNHHPAIVPLEQFEAIQKRLDSKKRSSKRSKRAKSDAAVSPLKGTVICASCGHSMTLYNGIVPAFQCKFTRNAPDTRCHRLSVPVVVLEEKVLRLAKVRADEMQRAALEQQSRKLELDVQQEDLTLAAAYEKLRNGEITGNEFARLKTKVAEDSCRAMQRRPAKEPIVLIHKLLFNTPTLTREIVECMIEKVLVGPNGEIEIQWKNPD